MPRPERHVFVCIHTKPPHVPHPSCAPAGGSELAQAFYAVLEQRELLGR